MSFTNRFIDFEDGHTQMYQKISIPALLGNTPSISCTTELPLGLLKNSKSEIQKQTLVGVRQNITNG